MLSLMSCFLILSAACCSAVVKVLARAIVQRRDRPVALPSLCAFPVVVRRVVVAEVHLVCRSLSLFPFVRRCQLFSFRYREHYLRRRRRV